MVSRISFRKISKGGWGGNWRNQDFKGGAMIVKDVTKFHKCHLGLRYA